MILLARSTCKRRRPQLQSLQDVLHYKVCCCALLQLFKAGLKWIYVASSNSLHIVTGLDEWEPCLLLDKRLIGC